MLISFMVDGIRDANLLHTQSKDVINSDAIISSYNGKDYCDNVLSDVIDSFDDSWDIDYQGDEDIIGYEFYRIGRPDSNSYDLQFIIRSYGDFIDPKACRLECEIVSCQPSSFVGYDYDYTLEQFKITLKDRLLCDWNKCTWLHDDQSAGIATQCYSMIFACENNLRSFVGKVLNHFLGSDWINLPGMEKYCASVGDIRNNFGNQVPEFNDINVDLLSVTIGKLSELILKGIVFEYKLNVSYDDLLNAEKKQDNQIVKWSSIKELLKTKRVPRIKLWDDLFSKYITDQNDFQNAMYAFVADRNHIAHNKPLTVGTYNHFVEDIKRVSDIVYVAIAKFSNDEQSNEMIANTEIEKKQNEDLIRQYERMRISTEAGIDLRDNTGIIDIFNEKIEKVYDYIWQRYRLNENYDISDFYPLEEENRESDCFNIQNFNNEKLQLKIVVTASCILNEEPGDDSICEIDCADETGKHIFHGQIVYHNGNAKEDECGTMYPIENSWLDDESMLQLQDFIDARIRDMCQ